MRVFRTILTLACITLASVQGFSSAANFAKVVPYGSGSVGANSVVAVDVNGDGFPDIVVATNAGVTVMLNDGLGDGLYLPPTTYSTGGEAPSESVAVMDVNGDGFPDIVVTNMCSEDPPNCYGVAVLLNNSNNPGTFLSAVGYNTGGLDTGAVAVGDVNGDGLPDLVVTNGCAIYTCAGGSLALLLNNSNNPGTFLPFHQLSDAKGPVAIGQMTSDGCNDLVTAAGVMLNNCDGTGTFQPASGQVAGGANFIALADLNHDGNLDVVSVLPTTVAIQLGNGDGTIQLQAVKYATGGKNPLAVAIADINGDNFPDLAVVNECSTTLTNGVCEASGYVGVLAGNGDGTFKAAVSFASGGSFGTSVSAADANQDGKIDLIVANACTGAGNCDAGAVGVLLNNYVAATTMRVTTSLTPVVLGQSVTFTATVTSTLSGSIVPDGSPITFTDGTTTLGTATTVSGVATLTTSFSKTGTQVVVATYSGDLFHDASHSSVVEVVNGYTTSVALSSNLNPANYGQTVIFTVVVTSSGPVIPTGTITFRNGTALLGTGTLNGTGTATLSTAKLAVGASSITASYNGDSLNAKSASSALLETVNQAQLTMTLTQNWEYNTAPYGQSVVFTATLSSNGGFPTGTVTFSSNGITLGTATLSNGIAIFSTTKLPAGTDAVTATFTGNADFSSASASITMTVIT